MKMKKMICLLLVLMMTLSLAACSGESGGSENTGADTAEGEKVLYSNGGPTEFFETPWLNPGNFLYNKVLYDRLLHANANLEPLEGKGQMAESYEMSEDGQTLSFTLREGLKWHDGEPVTAKDVKWSIEYGMKTTVLNAVFVSTFTAIEGAEAYLDGSADEVSGIKTDGNTITITFSDVAPDALLTFTQFAILPQKYFADVDPINFQQAEFFQSPIGSGPFKVKEANMNDYTILEAYADYWDGAAEFAIQLSPSAGDSDPNLVTNAKAGKIDYAYTKNIDDVKALEGVEGIDIEQIDVRYTRLLYPNKFDKKDGTKSPLADERVRQAIAYALDLDSILDGIFEGAALPANSLTPDGADKVDGLNKYEYNPEKAKELLKEANWDPNRVLDVVYYYTDQATVDLMTIIQSYLEQVGMKMEFRLVEGDLASILWSHPEDPVKGPSAVDWDMAYGAVSALSMHEYYDRFYSESSLNSHTPYDEELDKLIDATNSSVDPNVQKEAFFELQKYENETLFNIPLYYQPVFVVKSAKIVEGATDLGNPQFNFKWDIHKWVLK